jgi:hypothetical protein
MNRRTLIAAGASVVAVTASSATAGILNEHLKRAGEKVTLSGWMRPAAAGPGHYFVLGPHADIGDPRAADFAQWPDELTLVFPADKTALRAGKATLEGRLHRGRYRDIVTGHAARAVLTEARFV